MHVVLLHLCSICLSLRLDLGRFFGKLSLLLFVMLLGTLGDYFRKSILWLVGTLGFECSSVFGLFCPRFVLSFLFVNFWLWHLSVLIANKSLNLLCIQELLILRRWSLCICSSLSFLLQDLSFIFLHLLLEGLFLLSFPSFSCQSPLLDPFLFFSSLFLELLRSHHWKLPLQGHQIRFNLGYFGLLVLYE